MTNTKAGHTPLPWGLKEEGSDEFWFGDGYISLGYIVGGVPMAYCDEAKP